MAGWPVRHPRVWPLVAASALAGAAAAAQVLYALGWDNGLVSDDWFFLYGASKVETPGQLLQFFSFDVEAFVRPTQWLLTVGLYRLVGAAPAGYHVVSQALDLANALLVWWLARQLFAMLEESGGRARELASGLVAVLFLFSWRHHEAVFWFSALNELLACGFRLVTLTVLVGWLRGRGRPGPVAAAMLVASGLAMLSKESAAVLPLEALMLVVVAHVARRRPATAWRADLTLAGVPGVVVLAWAWLFVRTSTLLPGGLARGVSQTLTATPGEWILRFVQFFNANYAGAEAISASEPALVLELAALTALMGVAVARRRALWLFAAAWTAVLVAPYAAVSHGPDVGLVRVLVLGVRGDRFLYASGAAASLLLVATGLWLLDEVAAGTTSRRWLPAARSAALVAVAGLVALHGVRLRTAEAEWHAAGQIVRQVTTQLRQQWPQPGPSEMVCLARVPHTWDGKPVYRNGLAESVVLAYGYDGFAVERFENLREPAARTRCTATFVYMGSARGLVRARVVAGPAGGGGGA